MWWWEGEERVRLGKIPGCYFSHRRNCWCVVMGSQIFKKGSEVFDKEDEMTWQNFVNFFFSGIDFMWNFKLSAVIH